MTPEQKALAKRLARQGVPPTVALRQALRHPDGKLPPSNSPAVPPTTPTSSPSSSTERVK